MTVLIAFAPTMVGGDEDLQAGGASRVEHLPHVLDDIVRFQRRAAEFVELASLRQEIVVGIDDQQPSQLRLVRQSGFRLICHIPRLIGASM
ncbi:TPA: hypothetical protein ACYLN4_007995 [Burkholderia lata]|uniref:hypothetical protein n=1 Tax=Burkholderia cepacia complex TaxID=87882 RepID=UPI003075B83D